MLFLRTLPLLSGLVIALASCGSDDAAGANTTDAGNPQAPDAGGDAASSHDSATDDAHVDPDAAKDGAAQDPNQPNPPAGWSMCGSGSFTQADGLAVCSAYLGGPKNCAA